MIHFYAVKESGKKKLAFKKGLSFSLCLMGE